MAEHPQVKIVILDGGTLNPGDIAWEPLERLGSVEVYARSEESQIASRASGADILVTNKVPVSDSLLESTPTVRGIAVTATGYNVVDVAAAKRRGIPVFNVPEYGTRTVAQYTFALILELCHHVGRHADSVSRGDWQRSSDWCYWLSPQIELAGKKLGVVGFGRIGRRVGEIAHAMGMEVLAYDSHTANPPAYESFKWASLNDLFAESDVVTLHCPQTSENARMINGALLKRMRPTSFLINASRGGLIDEADLAEQLNQGTIAGAAVDVVSHEPMRADNPLLKAKNCIITPHIAWATLDARQRMVAVTASNIAAFLAGKPANVVNS